MQNRNHVRKGSLMTVCIFQVMSIAEIFGLSVAFSQIALLSISYDSSFTNWYFDMFPNTDIEILMSSCLHIRLGYFRELKT